MNSLLREEREPKQVTRSTYDISAVALAEYFRGIGSRVIDIDRALSLVGKEDGLNALELGCGDGRDGVAINQRVSNYIGLDYSFGMIAAAHETYPDIDFRVADMTTADFPNNQDVIYAFASILHLDKKELRVVLAKCYASLNEGGILYVSTKYMPEYTSEWKNDKFGNRYFYFYNPDEIASIAPVGLQEVYRNQYVIHQTDWFDQAFKKMINRESEN